MELKELESEILETINECTLEVCSTMLMLEVKAEESYIKSESNVCSDLISSLHFFGPKYMGKIAIFASGAASCGLAGSMLGMEVETVDTDVKDCMGEIVNMIAGSAKTKLIDTLGNVHLLTPWIIAGKDLSIATHKVGDGNLSLESQAQFSWIMTRFNFGDNHFMVGVQPNEVPAG